jgi:hypothetical protein
MTEGAYIPGDGVKLSPTAIINANRLVGLNGEQCTAGANARAFVPTAIAAGADGVGFDYKSGSWLVEAGAAIPLALGGGTYEIVMSDANGRIITYVAGVGVKQVGLIFTAASAATHKVEVFPIAPQL